MTMNASDAWQQSTWQLQKSVFTSSIERCNHGFNMFDSGHLGRRYFCPQVLFRSMKSGSRIPNSGAEDQLPERRRPSAPTKKRGEGRTASWPPCVGTWVWIVAPGCYCCSRCLYYLCIHLPWLWITSIWKELHVHALQLPNITEVHEAHSSISTCLHAYIITNIHTC